MEESFMLLVQRPYEKLRSPNLSFSCGVSYLKLLTDQVSHDRVDWRWLSSCQPGKKDCDRCAPGA